MSGYGHDESAPTPGGLFATNFVGGRGELRSVLQPISWWTWGIDGVFRNQFRGGRGELTECFAGNFVGVKGTFTKCSPRVRNLFDIHS